MCQTTAHDLAVSRPATAPTPDRFDPLPLRPTIVPSRDRKGADVPLFRTATVRERTFPHSEPYGCRRGASATCEPTPDGSGCQPITCPIPGQICQSTRVDFDPVTGQTVVTQCHYTDIDECHVQTAVAAARSRDTASDPCVLVDDGSGTIRLPPDGCEYLSPEEVHEIIDANSGITFELAPIHKDFICSRGDGFPGCPPHVGWRVIATPQAPNASRGALVTGPGT